MSMRNVVEDDLSTQLVGEFVGREIIDLIVSILLHPGTRGREWCQ